MTGAQMRYFNLNAGYKANFALKVRLALSVVHNYENGNSKKTILIMSIWTAYPLSKD